MDDEEMDEDIIALVNDEGKTEEFEFLDYFEYENLDYIVLLPVDSTVNEAYIMQVIDSSENENESVYFSVDDDELLDELFDVFKERNKDVYDFSEDE